jgi:hypothetical protein
MSNYTKSTNFATKDNLSSSNPLKIVKGTEIDTEFNNIQIAIATKADTGGTTGTVTSVAGAGTVNGITLTGTVISSGSLTLGGTLSGVNLTSQVTGTLPVANGGTGSTTLAGAGIVTLTGTQTVSGSKTFSGTTTISGGSGFGATASSTIPINVKPFSSSGTGIAAQNNGGGVPIAVASNATGGTLITFYDGTLPSSVTTNGYIQLNGAGLSYYSASDYRLKENIAPLSNAITKLKQIAPKTYTWIRHPETGTIDGFIAHELQTVAPYAVSGAKDEIDADGNPKYQGVDSSHLVPLLTAALQEAITRIEALEARITALESK